MSKTVWFLGSVNIAWNFSPPAFPLNSSIDRTRGSAEGFGKLMSFMRLKTVEAEIPSCFATEETFIVCPRRLIARKFNLVVILQ